ncbi:uncharacterized protein LOC135262574, partial [Anguilla rostrata]|uniref:uncharacterized protein LOC135262574 n=1 Tax=Anguilla rostrata TaxID=7938 RepID=UPI0030CDD7DD
RGGSSVVVLNLGVKVDADLKLDSQVRAVVKSSFYHLRQLAKIKPILSRQQFEIVIHAFITTRLDYCNALYVGVSASSISRLQMVQNAAARLLTGTRKHEHISPILASLHWLPIHFRIHFKIILFAFKSLSGLAPPYLSELLHPYTPTRSLRSADQLLLRVPKTKLKLRGDRAFAVAAPTLWNDLPQHIRQASSLSVFKSLVKTHLFSLAFDSYTENVSLFRVSYGFLPGVPSPSRSLARSASSSPSPSPSATPRPTFRGPGFTQAPMTPCSTFGGPGHTHAPVTPHLTFGGPCHNHAPVTPHMTFGGPCYTQTTSSPRPTLGGPDYTQAPVTPCLTFGGPGYTQAPVKPCPTPGKTGITQAPVTPHPTTGGPGYTQAPVKARPTLGKPEITQAPVTLGSQSPGSPP